MCKVWICYKPAVGKLFTGFDQGFNGRQISGVEADDRRAGCGADAVDHGFDARHKSGRHFRDDLSGTRARHLQHGAAQTVRQGTAVYLTQSCQRSCCCLKGLDGPFQLRRCFGTACCATLSQTLGMTFFKS